MNLVVYSPSGAAVGTSDSYDNSYEIVEFTAPAAGTYDATVYAKTFNGSFEYLGFAKTVPSLSGWDYRKQKNITGTTAGAQTNYQMKLTVYNSTGTDTPGVVYLGGNARSDFGDIRFTKSDGVTLLDYWTESYTSGASATVWVEVDSIPASPNSVDIYLYYGNPSATSASSGDATFAFFDDFNAGTSPDTNKWTVSGTGSATISGSVLTITSTGTNVFKEIVSIKTFSNNFILESYARVSGVGRLVAPIAFDVAGDNRKIDLEYWNDQPSVVWYNLPDGWDNTGWTKETSMYHNWVIKRTTSNTIFIMDSSSITKSDSFTTSYPVNFKTRSTGDILLVDWVRVRKYASPEPTWGA